MYVERKHFYGTHNQLAGRFHPYFCFDLFLVAKPSLLETFDDARLQPGSFVSMKCVASGNPKPEITWSRDGEIVMSSARLSLSIDYTGDGNIVSYVNVTNIRVQDGGEYRCSATNSVGEAVHTGRVDVFGKLKY